MIKRAMNKPFISHNIEYRQVPYGQKSKNKRMKRGLNNIYSYLGVFLISLTIISCNDILIADKDNVLSPDQHYRNIYDANAAVLGVYGKLLELAPQIVVLNELRADLMDVTYNADHHLREISEHRVTEGNPWADPQPFFSVINNCNDVMQNLDLMLKNNRITEDEHDQRYSDIGAVRTWVYLQLIVHYGEVPYITEPINDLNDIAKIDAGVYPKLKIDVMIDSLVNFMESIPYKTLYVDENLLLSSDGINPFFMYIDKEYLLGELHLWNGDYLIAAAYFKNIMERYPGNMDRYKIPTDFFTFSHYHCGYVRYYDNDVESVVNKWGTMFSTYSTSGDFADEWIWVISYSAKYMPSPFFELFSNTKGLGNYYLKPSKVAMDNWESQIQQNGFKGDFRGNIEDENGNSGSYKTIMGEPVITKFISEYNDNNPLDKTGKWYLWRAPSLHLHYCEAANRDGKYQVAYSLLNNGFRPNYSPLPDTIIDGNAIYTNDYTYYHQTLLPFPYNFDARSTSTSQIPPGVRALWNRGEGIRSRAYLQNFPYDAPEGMDSILYLEDKIIEESALELAFEGARWPDLVRIAMRRYNDNPNYLADKVYQKLLKNGATNAEEVRTKLSNMNNWWLPLTFNNDSNAQNK